MLKARFFYHSMPIDEWSGWQKPSDLFKFNKRSDGGCFGECFYKHWWDFFWADAFAFSQNLFIKYDIEEIGDGPLVTRLPNPQYTDVACAWKLNSNGTTFIASTLELPWLNDGCQSIDRLTYGKN